MNDTHPSWRRSLDPLAKAACFAKLKEFSESLLSKGHRHIGYPANAAFNLDEFFAYWQKSPMSSSPLNDVGNPYQESPYTLNGHAFELEAIEKVAPWFSLDPAYCWGYVTSGGTAGNEQGLYMGRERLLAHGEPILYVSEQAHYSVKSLGKILDLEIREIHCRPNGEAEMAHFQEILDPSRPALIVLCIGTTFKGAVDRIEDFEACIAKKKPVAVHYHADAALFGGFLPFIDDPKAPKIDFEKLPYDSIAVSGHKFFGSPIPYGIFLTRIEHLSALAGEYIDYIDTNNYTIGCSRSTLATLIFWWTIQTTPQETFVKEAKTILENARYLHGRLLEVGVKAFLNPYSNTVYFTQPSYELCRKWLLARQDCPKLGPLAHVVVMQHVSKDIICDFIADIERDLQSGAKSMLWSA